MDLGRIRRLHIKRTKWYHQVRYTHKRKSPRKTNPPWQTFGTQCWAPSGPCPSSTPLSQLHEAPLFTCWERQFVILREISDCKDPWSHLYATHKGTLSLFPHGSWRVVRLRSSGLWSKRLTDSLFPSQFYLFDWHIGTGGWAYPVRTSWVGGFCIKTSLTLAVRIKGESLLQSDNMLWWYLLCSTSWLIHYSYTGKAGHVETEGEWWKKGF